MRTERWFRRTALTLLALAGGFSSLPAVAADYAIVANRTIYRGMQIDVGDLKAVELIRQPAKGLRFVSSFDEIVGRVANRTILPGRFIAPSSLRAAYVVRNGDIVRVAYVADGLSISLSAIALSDATPGSAVTFRNPQSGRTFIARVRPDGTAQVMR